MKKPSKLLIIKIAAIAAAVATVVTLVIIFRSQICEFANNMSAKVEEKRKSNKFQEYFDFEDLDSI